MIGGIYQEDNANYGNQSVDYGSDNDNIVVPNDDFLLGLRDYGTATATTTESTTSTNSSGQSSNIDSSTVGGVYFLTDTSGAVTGFGYDYDDLYRFDIRFANLRVEHRRWLASAELMAQHLWDRQQGVLTRQPAWRFTFLGAGPAVDFGWLPVADVAGPTMIDALPKVGRLQGFKTADYFAYGVRYNDGRDEFEWGGLIDGDSGWGSTYANTSVQHRMIGPQIAVGRVATKGRWRFDLSGTLMLGYGAANSKQQSSFGSNVTGGSSNNAAAPPHISRHAFYQDYFAQHAELRLTTSYQFKRYWTLEAMARGFITSHWTDASEQINYTLPTFGLNRTDAEPLAGANLFLGVTYLR